MYSSTAYQTIPDVWIEHDEKVRSYVWAHRIVRLIHLFLNIGILVTLMVTYKLLDLQQILDAMFSSPFVEWFAYFFIVGMGWKAIGFPFQVAGYIIERKYKLSNQNFVQWLVDDIKGLMVGSVIATCGLFAIWCLDLTSKYWWIWAYLFFVFFSILLAQLAPILLIPIFFKLEPMKEGPLKARLLALCEKFNITVENVYHLGLAEKTEKGNAAFVGLGPTKRVMIGDTLYKKYDPEEVEAVFAHELGHQVNNDLWKGIGVGSVLLFSSMYFAQWLSSSIVFIVFSTSFEEPFGMLLFFVVLSVVRIPMGFFQALFSRSRETLADNFASQELSLGQPLADALEKLTLQNFSYFSPHVLVELFSYTHPAPWRRILALRGAI